MIAVNEVASEGCQRSRRSGLVSAHHITILAVMLVIRSSGGDLTLAVEDSGSKAVDALVVKLVSKRPAPYPSGYSDEAPYLYMTPEVEAATKQLKRMGPPIFPALVKHLRDDRYSYSAISAAWENCSVGDSVVDILSDGHYMHSGYKARKTPAGFAACLSFKDYLQARGPEAWAEWAKTKTRLQVQLDFIEWCIKEEQERGFTDEGQRKGIPSMYESAKERVTKEHSEAAGVPTSVAKASMANDVKAVLFCRNGSECFLSEVQIKHFVEIVRSLRQSDQNIEGKALPQEFIFYYWDYCRQTKDMVKHSISFNGNGGSIYWRMNESESHKIRALIKELVKTAK